jgi:very-short-patch-repair endonuclease
VSHVVRAYRVERGEPPLGRRIVDLAARQGGAIAGAQLRALGCDHDRVHRAVRAGWLISVHRGVYRVGALSADGVLFAARLALGPAAAVSHLSCAHHLTLLRGRVPATVDVTVATTRRHRRAIRVHKAPLDERDITTRRGLRVTTVSRTLLDVAPGLTDLALQAAVDEARIQRRLHIPTIEATIARSPGHHGIGALRRAVARHDSGRGHAIGDLERHAIAFLRDRAFAPYERNFTVVVEGEPFMLDVVWLQQRVALELDSRNFHDNDPAFATDRRRSRRLAAAGWQVVRGTWEDLDLRPRELASDVHALLRAAKVA